MRLFAKYILPPGYPDALLLVRRRLGLLTSPSMRNEKMIVVIPNEEYASPVPRRSFH